MERVIDVDYANLPAPENFPVGIQEKKHRVSSGKRLSTMGCATRGWISAGTQDQRYFRES